MSNIGVVSTVNGDEVRQAGQDFGFARLSRERMAFEVELAKHLASLAELLDQSDGAAVAASFEYGAREAWEIGKG